MHELQKIMFIEDLAIALFYFICFGVMLLVGGSFEAAGRMILDWARGSRD